MQSLLSFLGRRPVAAVRPAVAALVPPLPEVADVPTVAPANGPFDDEPRVGRVTATALWEAFDRNEAAAESRFGHRPLYIGGAVERVSREGPIYVVKLSVSGAWFDTVRCEVAGDNRFNVAMLKRGQLAFMLSQRVFQRRGRVIAEGCIVVEDDLTALPERGGR